MRHSIAAPFALLLGLCAADAAPARAAAVQAEHVVAELIGERSALAPGSTAWLGIRLQHEPHWHTYWINPGDSGQATRLTWSLPPGFSAGPIAWPAPARLAVGDLTNFGYVGELLLPVPIAVPATAEPGSDATILVDARWLVCAEICLPGGARLELTLPVQAESATAVDPRWSRLFASARARQPVAVDWPGSARDLGSEIVIDLRMPTAADPSALDAFAVQAGVIENAVPTIRRSVGGISIRAAKSEYFVAAPAQLDLVLVAAPGAAASPAWRVSVPFRTEESSSASHPH